ncbi:aldehyde dehydrogenase family protein [Hydrogenophaga sp.]|uniref:aldehyde dehydrogenase family protein n=1 Tax=Hydrogenophaga sp. TaxID=1904254 RepID=UPI00272602C0|nr:aldehyde dehydrogenase family protein [Hydrogenophaga sp.]MDO9438239.1 aldehyde dehydrogenase family protein [Hydrogenophaga sp.]
MPNASPGLQPHDTLPLHRDLYYGGAWHESAGGRSETFNPSTGESLGFAAQANAADVDAMTQVAHRAFLEWRKTKPIERATALRRIAAVLRENADELALLDALNCGNPVRDMRGDSFFAATQLEFFAGLVTEMKGDTLPMGPGNLNITLREPLGVCARILAYNHPLMFVGGKIAAPLAAGNSVIVKPPVQAPLSAFRFMELIDGILPPGVLNIASGGQACGEALVNHPLIPMVTLIGSVQTGRAIARAAGDRLKRVLLELGGKNALLIYPDADLEAAIGGAVRGMNFGWCGQSCGSTSRVFVHESLHDRFVDGVVKAAAAYKPGLATDADTNMGALISREHRDRVMGYIDSGKEEGARLVLGGAVPRDAALAGGHFVEPTIFADVTPAMRIAREEIFGPVLSIIKWSDHEQMLQAVDNVEYGLTAAVYTRDLGRAHQAASSINAGSISVNSTAFHFLGAPFGGNKLSGIGREESIEELFEFTQLKNVNISFASNG